MDDLFPPDPHRNLLPHDGEAYYHGPILTLAEAQRFEALLMKEVPWAHDEAVFFGKRIVTARKVAWYGDRGFSYTYSGATKEAIPWSDDLRELKELTERVSGCTYNSCLLNLYHSGDEGMAWHSDDEKTLQENGAIASLSLGAERVFRFKHKQTDEIVSVMLENGSLLMMQGATQTHWRHCLPKTKKVKEPRINLTFRTMAPC